MFNGESIKNLKRVSTRLFVLEIILPFSLYQEEVSHFDINSGKDSFGTSGGLTRA